MRNRIIELFNGYVSEVSLFVIMASLLSGSIAAKIGASIDIEMIFNLVAAIIFFALIIWATICIVGNIRVKEMPVRLRIALETTTRLFAIVWFFLALNIYVAIISSIFFIWQGVRSFKESL